jgi:hypothetical protein
MCYTGVLKTSRRWKTSLCKDAHMDFIPFIVLVAIVVVCEILERKWKNEDEFK